MMDAVSALLPVDDDDGMPEDDDAKEESSKDSPGLGMVAIGAAMALAMLARRKLRKT
jgi:hypothetical protein